MKAFLIHVWLQFKMDFRERNILITFYIVPLVFYAVMGAVFSSINPMAKATLSASMSLFAVTMGAVLGTPAPLAQMRADGTLRAWRVTGIPGSSILFAQGISSFLHLTIVSLIITATAPLLFGAQVPVNYWAYFGIMLLFIIASIAIGLLIGVTAKNPVIFSQLIFLPSLLLGGLMFPTAMLPAPLMWVGRLLPATHAMEALTGAAFSLESSIVPSVSVAAIAVITIIVSAAVAVRFNQVNRIK